MDVNWSAERSMMAHSGWLLATLCRQVSQRCTLAKINFQTWLLCFKASKVNGPSSVIGHPSVAALFGRRWAASETDHRHSLGESCLFLIR